MNRQAIGTALLSSLLFGISPPLAKLFLAEVHPVLLAGLLYAGAGLGLAAVAAVRGSRHEARLARGDLPWLALVVLTGGVAGPLLLMTGLAQTDSAGASLLLNIESLATLAIAWLVFRENVDRRLLAGAGAILAGAVVLSWQGLGRPDPGALLVVGACIAWGIDNNLTRRLSGADPVQIAMVKGLVAGAVNLALALWLGAPLPPALLAMGAGMLGFLCYGFSLVLFVVALRHLGAARTGAYFAMAPFVGASVALVVPGEPLTPRLVAAAGLMGVGLWLHLTERHDHAHDHPALAHAHRHVHDAHHQHAHDPDDPPGEPHSHWHVHAPLRHSHPHYPDLHHRHDHG